jgi:hypothetical protein
LSKFKLFTENILASKSGWQKEKYFIEVCLDYYFWEKSLCGGGGWFEGKFSVSFGPKPE